MLKHYDFDHLELTYKNHFRFGYGPQFLNEPDNENKWTVAYGNSQNGFQNFYKECLNTVQLLQEAAANLQEDIWILFSGGIDSEVVLRSFQAAGVEFKVAILQFSENLNIHDISYAVMLCDQLKIDYKIYTLDLKAFWGSKEYWEYAEMSVSSTPQLIPHMWLVNQIKGYCVIGSGEPYYVRANVNLKGRWLKDFTGFHGDRSREGWHLWEKEKIAALFRFFMATNKKGCPAFFQYTPEIIDSFTYDPAMQKFLLHSKPEILTSFHAKHSLYSQYFPLVKRTKYTGYENVKNEDLYHRQALVEKFPNRNAVYRTKVELQARKRTQRRAVWPIFQSLREQLRASLS